MTTMKIGSLTETYATASFSFTNNPQTIKVPLSENFEVIPVPYGKMHILVGAGGVGTRELILTGTMKGSSRHTDFNNLGKQIHDNNIKKFWISSSKFFYVKGRSIDTTFDGSKNNFLDYVANLTCIYPYACGTEKTYTVVKNNATETALNDATSGSTGKFENAGSVPALVEFTIENVSSAAITKIEIGDASTLAASKHYLVWTGSLSSGNTLKLYIFKYVDDSTRGTFKSLRLGYPEIGGVNSGNTQLIGSSQPWVDAGATDQTFSIKLTGCNNTTNITATWFESWIE